VSRAGTVSLGRPILALEILAGRRQAGTTCATTMRASFCPKGVNPALVAERLGHDFKTLLRTYAHVIRQDEDWVRRSWT
jgi:hypothetical protein